MKKLFIYNTVFLICFVAKCRLLLQGRCSFFCVSSAKSDTIVDLAPPQPQVKLA
jgi:hypothetical protein